MKWYNKDNTECLDTDSIKYWKFFPAENNLSQIRICVDGSSLLEFYGIEAEEIYKILTSKKEVI